MASLNELQDGEPQQLGKLTIFLTVIGIIFWVSICSLAFWYLLRNLDEGFSSTTVVGLAWPFTTMVIAVPLIVTLLLGGIRLIGRVISLRRLLSELPEQISHFDKFGNALKTNKDKLEEVSEDLGGLKSGLADLEGLKTSLKVLEDFKARLDALSGQVDELASSVADQSSRQRAVGTGEEISSEAGGLTTRVEMLNKHLQKAKDLFNDADKEYSESTTYGGVYRSRGWILPESVEELAENEFLSRRATKYILAVIQVDRETRRAARSNLTEDQVRNLDNLEPE